MTAPSTIGLLELAERCEKATGPDYALECEIWDAIYPGERDGRFRKLTEEGPYKGRLGPAERDGYVKPLRAFTASLDAALTLVPEGFDWIIGRTNSGLTIHAEVGGQGGEFQRFANTPALALCAAALRAIASQHLQESER